MIKIRQSRFPYTVSLTSFIEAMIGCVQPSLVTSRTIRVKTSAQHLSKDITLKHSQGFCNPPRPNSLRGTKEPNINLELEWMPELAESLTVYANFTVVQWQPGVPRRARWMSSWWEGHREGEEVGTGGATLLRENPLRWPSKRQMKKQTADYLGAEAEAALRWLSDSPVIYYPTNPESGALRKSSTADCCCLGIVPSPRMCRRWFVF